MIIVIRYNIHGITAEFQEWEEEDMPDFNQTFAERNLVTTFIYISYWFTVCLVFTVAIINSFRAEPKSTTDSEPEAMRYAKNTLPTLMLLQQLD